MHKYFLFSIITRLRLMFLSCTYACIFHAVLSNIELTALLRKPWTSFQNNIASPISKTRNQDDSLSYVYCYILGSRYAQKSVNTFGDGWLQKIESDIWPWQNYCVIYPSSRLLVVRDISHQLLTWLLNLKLTLLMFDGCAVCFECLQEWQSFLEPSDSGTLGQAS